MVNMVGNANTITQTQMFYEAVCISHSPTILGKIINLTSL